VLVALSRATSTRLCAVWLVTLAALPFTAPFAAFDWSALVGGGHSQTTFTTAAPLPSHVRDDGADDAPASSGRVKRMRSIRLCDLRPCTSAHNDDAPAARTTRPRPTTTPPSDGTSALVTILRL